MTSIHEVFGKFFCNPTRLASAAGSPVVASMQGGSFGVPVLCFPMNRHGYIANVS
jgi:hypothetical protein